MQSTHTVPKVCRVPTQYQRCAEYPHSTKGVQSTHTVPKVCRVPTQYLMGCLSTGALSSRPLLIYLLALHTQECFHHQFRSVSSYKYYCLSMVQYLQHVHVSGMKIYTASVYVIFSTTFVCSTCSFLYNYTVQCICVCEFNFNFIFCFAISLIHVI